MIFLFIVIDCGQYDMHAIYNYLCYGICYEKAFLVKINFIIVELFHYSELT